MWFQDLVNGNWYHVETVVYFYVVADGAAWDVRFVSTAIGVQTYQAGYPSKLLAETALAALVATFTV